MISRLIQPMALGAIGLILGTVVGCQATESNSGEHDAAAPDDTDSEIPYENPDCESNLNCTKAFCDQILIEAGSFTRGSIVQPEPPPIDGSCIEYGFGDETPQHQVELDKFCIDKYEVTRERYDACVKAGECEPRDVESSRKRCGAKAEPDSDSDHLPMLGVTPKDAHDYCHWIGRRLCSEAEWERVASGPGPERRTYPWGENRPTYGWPGFNSFEPVPVDQNPEGTTSAEGVANLAGSAGEFVMDYYAPYDVPDGGVLVNPTGPTTGDSVILRGGAYSILCRYKNTERIFVAYDASGSSFFDW